MQTAWPRKVRQAIGLLALLTLPLVFGGCALVIQSLTADFTATPTAGAAALTVQFTESVVVDPPRAMATYRVLWDFGDGTTSTQRNPTHIYAAPGVYTVTLTVTAGHGNLAQTVTVTKTDYIQVASSGGYVPPPPTGTGSAADINTAIDNAGAGGLVIVGPGTYTGDVVVDRDGVTVRAVPGETPVVEGRLIVDADGVTVQDLEFTGALETTPFASFVDLTLTHTLLYGQTFNTTLSCDDVVNDGESVQASLDAATGGETVCVGPGTYVENLDVQKPITLRSIAGPDVTTLQGLGGPSGVAIRVRARDVTLRGFTIKNPTGAFGIDISETPTTDNVLIENNVFTDIGPSSDDCNPLCFGAQGIWVEQGDGIVIRGNTFTNLTGEGSTKAVLISQSTVTTPLVTNLIFEDNVINGIVSNQRGGYGFQTAGPTTGLIVRNNTIQNLTGLWATGIGLESDTPNALVQGNTLQNFTGTTYGSVGVNVESNPSAATITVAQNNFLSGLDAGAVNKVTGTTLNAEDNWWGDASGPADPDGTTEVPPCTADPKTEVNADGTGASAPGPDSALIPDDWGYVDYCPWATSPF